MADFVGGDPESNSSECPAVFVDPQTGDFLFRGKTITDPALITALNEHIGKAEDESDGTNPYHYTFSSDPRTIRDITAAFEIAWDRATPHAEYKTE